MAGVGFTMSLFIAELAFSAGGAPLAASKLGVLTASGVAAALALLVGTVLLSPKGSAGAARSPDEAEGATEV